MNLKEQIIEDLKTAMKEKNQEALSTLRMLQSAIKNEEIDTKKDLDDSEIGKIVKKETKKRKDAIEQYEKGGRQELADKEKSEIEILKKYMPEELSEESIKKIVEETILSMKAEGPQDMGKVMGVVMPKLDGKADGQIVSKIVKESLNK